MQRFQLCTGALTEVGPGFVKQGPQSARNIKGSPRVNAINQSARIIARLNLFKVYRGRYARPPFRLPRASRLNGDLFRAPANEPRLLPRDRSRLVSIDIARSRLPKLSNSKRAPFLVSFKEEFWFLFLFAVLGSVDLC